MYIESYKASQYKFTAPKVKPIRRLINTSKQSECLLMKTECSLKKDVAKINVLLVEDNDINIKVATFMLMDFGFKNIVIAKTGKEAVSRFSNDVDIVILDLGLPDINGLEVAKLMRCKSMRKHIPIIAFTANAAATKEECLAVGMDDFAVKPLPTKLFLELVMQWLH